MQLTNATRFHVGKVAVGKLAEHLAHVENLRLTGDIAAANDIVAAIADEYPFSWQIAYQRGLLAQSSGNLDLAVPHYRRAAFLNTDALEPRLQLGLALYHLGLEAQAAEHFADALCLAPASPLAQLGVLVCSLRTVPTDARDAEQSLANYRAVLAELERSWAESPAALADAQREAVGVLQPFSLAYYGLPMVEEQRAYGRMLQDSTAIDLTRSARGTDAKIRLGIVSAFFTDHSNWWVPIKGWLENLDRSRFDVFVYHLGSKSDAQTHAAKASADVFHARVEQGAHDADYWVERIQTDAPDVLIYPETGMDILTLRLASQRLAPVQATSWGHPLTSGLASMDLYLSSDLMEPDRGFEHYHERLLRLPNSSLFLEPIEPVEGAAREALGCTDADSIYWCGQNLAKFIPKYDDVFARIAAETPQARFVFVEDRRAAVTARLQARLRRSFAEHRICFETHVRFLKGGDRAYYRSLLAASDIFLDSIGWSGCNTSLEAIAHDLPLLTLPGEVMRARHTYGFLRQMNLDHRAVANTDDYVTAAIELGSDAKIRALWSREIRQNKHKLYRDLTPVRALEAEITHALAAAHANSAS